jgi:hypothetical protein
MTDLASLAQSLKDNEAFQVALNLIREDARDKLGTVDPTSADTIREHQATIRVVDELRERFALMISTAAAKKPPGLA